MKAHISIALLTLTLAGATTLAQTTAPGTGEASATLPPSVAAPSYVIGAEDMLLISVWKEPDLTTTLPVRPDGNISLPLVNDVKAEGFTPMELAASIREKLRKYVTDPRVTVVVTQINSQKVYVTGEVLHTGAILLLPGMTVLQALADAGFTQFANRKAIYVLRAQNGKEERIPVNYKRLVKGTDADRNILLKPGDTIVVP